MTLDGLPASDVVDLARRAGVVNPSTEDGEHLREQTGGNPFFILNAARLVLAESRASGRDVQMNLPIGVRAVLERRLARLSQPCHELLRAAAIIGAHFDLPLLAVVGGVPVATAEQLLAEAVDARLAMALESSRYAFAHALVRATASAQLDPHEKSALHGLVADAIRGLAAAGERQAEIAHHELRAGHDRAATAGADAAMAAGRHAIGVRAFEEAAEHFRRAAEATADRQDAVGARLAEGDAHRRAGDWGAANEAYLAAATDARALRRGDLLAQAALGVGADVSGFEVRLDDPHQLELLADALDELGHADPLLRSRLLARRAVAGTGRVDHARRREWADQAVRLAREHDDARVVAYALSAWCDVHAGPDHTDDRLAAAEEMLTAAGVAGDVEAMLLARRFRVVALLENGDPAVHAEIEAFARQAEELGLPLYTWYVALWRGMQALLRGDLEEAHARADETMRLGEEAGSGNAQVLASTLLSGVMFERGQIAELMTMYAEAFAQFPHLRDTPIAVPMQALTAVVEGSTDRARAVLTLLADSDFASIPFDSEWISTLTAVAQSVFALQDVPAAEALYRVLQPYAGRVGVDGIAAVALDTVDYLLGRLAEIIGNAGAAITHHEDAVTISRRLGAPLLVAHAEYELGRLRAADGDAAGESLREAAGRALTRAGAVPPPRSLGPDVASGSAPPAGNGGGTFRFDGTSWELEYTGRTIRLPDAKGMHDLRHLLAHPGQPVPAVQLQRAGTDGAGTASLTWHRRARRAGARRVPREADRPRRRHRRSGPQPRSGPG